MIDYQNNMFSNQTPLNFHLLFLPPITPYTWNGTPPLQRISVLWGF